MAHHKSAVKRIRISGKRRLVNRMKRSKLNTLIKAVRNSKNKEEGETNLKRAVPYIDKLATKGLIHRNKAANQKSKLMKYVHSL